MLEVAVSRTRTRMFASLTCTVRPFFGCVFSDPYGWADKVYVYQIYTTVVEMSSYCLSVCPFAAHPCSLLPSFTHLISDFGVAGWPAGLSG